MTSLGVKRPDDLLGALGKAGETKGKVEAGQAGQAQREAALGQCSPPTRTADPCAGRRAAVGAGEAQLALLRGAAATAATAAQTLGALGEDAAERAARIAVTRAAVHAEEVRQAARYQALSGCLGCSDAAAGTADDPCKPAKDAAAAGRDRIAKLRRDAGLPSAGHHVTTLDFELGQDAAEAAATAADRRASLAAEESRQLERERGVVACADVQQLRQHWAELRDGEKVELLKRVLSSTPTGKTLADALDTYGVTTVFGPAGGGSHYSDERNTITIDRSHSPDQAVRSLTHEANHAEADRSGHTPDPARAGLTRQEYIDRSLAEEAAGDVRAFEVRRELDAIGVKIGRTQPLERDYFAAKAASIAAARAGNPNLTADQLEVIGRTAATRVVIDHYRDHAVTSTTGQRYPDFYGAIYDEAKARHP